MSQATVEKRIVKVDDEGNGLDEHGVVVKKAPERFSDMLGMLKSKLAGVLPKHLTPERMMKVVGIAATRQPKLLKCTQASVIQSVMTAAQLGLDCSGVLGSAYLLPYDRKKKIDGEWRVTHTECQLIIGYRGMIDLARRSGQIESVTCRAVYAGDDFTMEFGLLETLKHVPKGTPAAAALTGCYCIAKFVGGGHHIEYMTRAEIDAIRGRSKAKDDGPWVTDYAEMAKKTVVRRGFKMWPMSTELAQTLQEIATSDDDGVGARVVADIVDGTVVLNGDTDETTADAAELPESRASEVLDKLKEAGHSKTPNADARPNEPEKPQDPLFGKEDPKRKR